jgi:hypothetical protein
MWTFLKSALPDPAKGTLPAVRGRTASLGGGGAEAFERVTVFERGASA